MNPQKPSNEMRRMMKTCQKLIIGCWKYLYIKGTTISPSSERSDISKHIRSDDLHIKDTPDKQ